MTAIIITAIIAFDCGMHFGYFWANREKDHEETDQEWPDGHDKAELLAKETARRLMRGL